MAIQPDADEPPPDGPGVDNPAMEEPRADGAGDIEKNEVQQKTDIQKPHINNFPWNGAPQV